MRLVSYIWSVLVGKFSRSESVLKRKKGSLVRLKVWMWEEDVSNLEFFLFGIFIEIVIVLYHIF